MHVALDGTALGSGRGGDETLMRGLLGGLAEVASPQDRFSLYLPSRAGVPGSVARSPAFRVHRTPRLPGTLWYGIGFDARLASSARSSSLVFSVTHAPVWTRLPTALMVTDLSFVRHPEHYPPATRRRLQALVPRQARRAAAVLTLSEFCRQDIVDAFGLSPQKVFVVPCAPEPPHPLSDHERDRAERWMQAQSIRPPFFLYLGNLHPRKNVPKLIRSFLRARASSPAVAGHRLVVAGARWWGDEEVAESSAAPPGTVHLVGRVDQAQREHLLRSAAALAYPSLFEGFGLPPLEAMARGTPVLTSTAGAIPETVGDAALLVDADDPDAIAGGLVRLAEDSLLCRELVTRGRLRAATFTPARTASDAMRAFQAALGDGGGRAGAGRVRDAASAP
ncbi:MAG: glycosyltransferase family 4 protein [Actinomycetota bacterium]